MLPQTTHMVHMSYYLGSQFFCNTNHHALPQTFRMVQDGLPMTKRAKAETRKGWQSVVQQLRTAIQIVMVSGDVPPTCMQLVCLHAYSFACMKLCSLRACGHGSPHQCIRDPCSELTCSSMHTSNMADIACR